MVENGKNGFPYYIGLTIRKDGITKKFDETNLNEIKLLKNENNDNFVKNKKYILIQESGDSDNKNINILLTIIYGDNNKIKDVTVKKYDMGDDNDKKIYNDLEKYHLIERKHNYKITTFVESTDKRKREEEKERKEEQQKIFTVEGVIPIEKQQEIFTVEGVIPIAEQKKIETLNDPHRENLLMDNSKGGKRRGSKKMKRKNRKTTRSRRNA